MLSAFLCAGMVAAPLSFAGLAVPVKRRARVAAGWWPAIRRFMLAIAGTAVVTVAVALALGLLGITGHARDAAAAGVVCANLVWIPVTRRWTARARVCWASSIFLVGVYLTVALGSTFAGRSGAAGRAGGVLLWVFELCAAVLSCAYLWEICEALGTQHWRRRAVPEAPATAHADLPMISLHVPAHNEPPAMVIDTLRSLVRLDYPRYEIVVIDDNTDDEALWRPVQQWCAWHGVKFVHLEKWPGYKSGALNYALRHLTDPRAELIGVVDSDYQIEPGFLRACVRSFADPWIGFVQAPQDYRGWQQASYYRRLFYSYKYFFAISQPSRNEHDGAIFAGTMGLIRRVALDELGGWDEWCITEDAELSLRLLRAGWSGLHLDQSWGHGIMPLTFEALKGQRYRWCFGGIQILRRHWRSLIPGRTSKRNHLTVGQRWAYFAGAIQWYGDLLGLFFFVFLLAGAADLAVGDGQVFRKLTPLLLTTVPALFALGLVRSAALMRRGTGASWREAIGALFIWQSTSLTVAKASLLGLFARKAAFLRTPKTSERARWWQALKANWAESILALLGVAGIAGALTKATQPSGPLLAALLLFPTLGMAAAPYNSWAARRASLPPQLRERRHSEYRGERRAFAMGAATGGFVTALCAAMAIAVLILLPRPVLDLPHPAGPAASSTPTPGNRPAPGRSAPGNRPALGSTSAPGNPSAPSHPGPVPRPRTSARSRQSSDLPSGLSTYLPSDIPAGVLSDLP
jgi:glycosyltransferase involved in cell wall biosynthesis